MKRNLEFIKVGEFDLAPFNSYVEYPNGLLIVSSAEVFDMDKAHYATLPIKNQKALENFVKRMNKKYGKNNHRYSL